MRSRHPGILTLALPLLLGVAGLLPQPRPAIAQPAEGEVLFLVPERQGSKAARLRTAADPGDPDTVWIGHIWDPGFTAGGTMPAGGYGPYKVGRGPNRPSNPFGGQAGWNAVWDFDRFQPGETDSLQGWWPMSRPYQSAGTSNNPDFQRAFFGLDYGNNANYVINQGSPKRTFGVVGLWHRDVGNNAVLGGSNVAPGTNPVNVQWSPTEVGGPGSTACAWMGIRAHGDLSHRDEPSAGGTGNWFNASVNEYNGNNAFNQVGSTRVEGTDKNYPGYGSQLDQMLYRDIALAEGDGFNLSFNYSTNMSLLFNQLSNIRVGWFHKDPFSPAQIGSGPSALPSSDGNFISSSVAGATAPRDSFMVYIGAPVNDADCTYSDGLTRPVYGRQRRWFSEVLRIKPTGEGLATDLLDPGRQVLGVAGENPPTTFSVNIPAGDVVLQAIKDADGTTGDGGIVRLVFRVKTNRGHDDEDTGNLLNGGFSSGTRGAVRLDNVVVNNWAASNGDFEAASSINNDLAVSPLNAWKSTGKPPGLYFHSHLLAPGSGLVFDDPCGSIDSPNRFCSMYGKVISAGNHDLAEKPGGLFGSNLQDAQKYFISPTVNLKASGNGAGFYNAMGIDDEIAHVSGDYSLFFDLYTGGLKGGTNGNLMSLGYQSYPATQPNGVKCWGEVRHEAFIFFFNVTACFSTFFEDAKASGLLVTSNPDGTPDSLRAYIHQLSRCFTFTGLSAADCSPEAGANAGLYYDNISLALIDAAAPPGLSIAIWDLINDCFPANSNSALLTGPGVGGVGTAFDTTAAQVRSGFNIGQATGTPTRPNIAGDTTIVNGSGSDVRMDMIFRVLPGPGNYVTVGSRASGVARRPDASGGARVAATAADVTNFWGAYLANNGIFGSPGGHVGGVWSEHVWNSARLDTVERNLFPTANNATAVGLRPGVYATMLHEGDLGSDDQIKFNNLGIVKNRCFLVVPGGEANSSNITCSSVPPSYDAAAGYDGVQTTKEYTKILPDGMFTPGSHVQYFFRKSKVGDPPSVFEMGPDTNFVFQAAEGNFDGHRWQQFGVLPDRWKDGAWSIADRHAPAPACMLFVDWTDRRADELFWVSIADSIGATAEARRGAHNGWRARGDQDITVAVATDPTIAVYPHGGQPGTIWDMYGVKAAESLTTGAGSLGSRAAAGGVGLTVGKETKHGPTGDMLRHFYRTMFIVTGDLVDGMMGPYNDKSDNDIGLLSDFANTPGGTPQPRGVMLQGQGFLQGQEDPTVGGHPTFGDTYFGADLATGDYRNTAPNLDDVVDLTVFSPLNTTGAIYGVSNNCFIQNDVMSHANPALLNSVTTSRYPDLGGNAFIAGIYTPSSLPSTAHPFISLLDGFRITSLGGRNTLSTPGRIHYFYHALTNLFGAINCTLAPGQPVGVGDLPNTPVIDFLDLRSENPWRSGDARIVFGLTKTERVELRIYDVAGRLVRTVANRVFAGGQEHAVIWDGSDESGHPVARGVYFYQLRTPSFTSQKKLAVLKN